jgi:hypothetical protein
MRIPTVPRPGDTITAAWAEAVCRCLQALRIISIVGGRVTYGPGGTTLVVHPGEASSVAADTVHAFKLIPYYNTGTETNQIRVIYGTVQGTEPDGMVPGDEPPYTFTPTGTGYVWVAVTVDTEPDTPEITATEIDYGASIPADTDTKFHFQLGSWSVDAETDAISLGQSVPNSVLFAYCDGGPIWGW